MISCLDAMIGRLLDTLEETGLMDNPVVVHTSDHGEMLGEHGLWRKMCFYEQAARIPLQTRWDGVIPAATRIEKCVSMIDLTATILEVAGVHIDEKKEKWHIDGDSLFPLLQGCDDQWKDEAFGEHNAHGTDRPQAMLRKGKWKLCYSHGEPPEFELYDLEHDPGEFTTLADDTASREVRERMLKSIADRWDGERVKPEILLSQEERQLIRSVAPGARLF